MGTVLLLAMGCSKTVKVNDLKIIPEPVSIEMTDQVFLLDVAPEVIVKRFSGRRICRGCGAVYHVVNIPPKVDGVCDACGGELYQRPDDSESTVLNRLDVYNRQTAALISFYESKGVLVRIDASRSPSAAAAEMLSKLR